MGRNVAAKPEYATAKIAVFWNINHCPVPDGYEPRRVRPSIEAAFKKLGYSGPVSISAFGNTLQLSPGVLRGLNSTGIDVQHNATQWLWESLLGETSRNVLKKCSETGEAGKSAILSCELCGFYGQNLERFYKHLSSKQHVWEEDNVRLAVPVRPEPAEDKQVENSPKSRKRLKKAVPDLCS